MDGHRADRRVVVHLESSSPSATITGTHVVEPHPEGSRLTLTLQMSGPMGGLGWLLTRSLTRRYVETEGASIKKVSEAPAL